MHIISGMKEKAKGGSAEFAQVDFDRYMARIAPYDNKVDEGGMFSDEEVRQLKEIRGELWQTYTQTSLDQYRIVGHINSALTVDDVRKTSQWERELEKECIDLETRLDKGRADGTLTTDEKREMSRRRDEICYALDPTHFHGPPPQ